MPFMGIHLDIVVRTFVVFIYFFNLSSIVKNESIAKLEIVTYEYVRVFAHCV